MGTPRLTGSGDRITETIYPPWNSPTQCCLLDPLTASSWHSFFFIFNIASVLTSNAHPLDLQFFSKKIRSLVLHFN